MSLTAGDRVELIDALDKRTLRPTLPGVRGTVIRQHRVFTHMALLVRFDGDEASRWVRSNALRLVSIVEQVAELEGETG